MTFDEEFNAPLNSKLWVQQLWGLTQFSGEEEAYDPSAVSVSGGLLNLTARAGSINGSSYISGMVNTGPILGKQATGYSFRYGYVEARMKLVSGQGLWPAFWMLPDPNPGGTYHDGDGEIDLMEELGQQPTIDQVHLHLHGSAWGTGVNAGTDLSQDFHTYAVNWMPGEVDYYLDGNKVYTVNSAPSVPEYLIFNLAVGGPGSWPGAPNGSTQFPATMQVDYVHVWQNVPEPSSLGLLALGAVILQTRRRKMRHDM